MPGFVQIDINNLQDAISRKDMSLYVDLYVIILPSNPDWKWNDADLYVPRYSGTPMSINRLKVCEIPYIGNNWYTHSRHIICQ